MKSVQEINTLKEHLDDLELKSNWIDKGTEIEGYIKYFSSQYGFDCNPDTMAQEPMDFRTIGYSLFAGGMIFYPMSIKAQESYLQDIAYEPVYTNGTEQLFMNPKDKYDDYTKKKELKRIDKLVILPGSNILKSVVDRNKLMQLAAAGAMAKIHPVTVPELKEELTNIFGKKQIIAAEYGLYQCFMKAKRIYSTSASETSFYAGLMGKPLFSIEESDCRFHGAYSSIINRIFWMSLPRRQEYLTQLINSKITPIVHLDDEYADEKVHNTIKYFFEKRKQLQSCE